MDHLKKFILFDKFITPSIVQILFWIAVGITLIVGFFALLAGTFQGEFSLFFSTLIFVPLTIVVIRIYMELILLFFKIYEKLQSIDEQLKNHK